MVNSDDPAYFGGYVNENFLQTANALNLSESDILQLAKNSFIASFLPDEEKEKWLTELDNFRISNWEDIINESILNQYCPVKF